jgi:hypothetical protein
MVVVGKEKKEAEASEEKKEERTENSGARIQKPESKSQ